MDGGVEESFEKKRVDIRYRFFFKYVETQIILEDQ